MKNQISDTGWCLFQSCAIFIIIPIGIAMLMAGDEFTGVGAFLIIAAIAIIIYSCLPSQEEKEAKRKKQEEEQNRLRKEQERKEALPAGTWEFPTAKLLEKCKSTVKKADNEFELEKLRIAAKMIMDEEGAAQYFNKYCSDAQLKEYFLAATKAEKTAHEAELNEIHEAELDGEEKYLVSMAQECANKTGREKRVTMLEKADAKVSKQIWGKKEAAAAMSQLGYHFSSASYQKPRDWGTVAGFADAIAGPGAGAATALSIQAENARIEAQNRANLERIATTVNGVNMSLHSEEWELEKERKVIRQELEKAKMLVVPKVEQNTKEFLTECITLGEFKTKRPEDRAGKKRDVVYLESSVSLNTSKVDGLSLEKYTIDGVLKAKVYANNKCIDTVILPFPLYGLPIKKNSQVMVEGICAKYTKRGKYKVVPEIHNLWLVEK